MVNDKPLMRAYSIVSANYEEHMEFFSIKVQDGPLTSRLQKIKVGDKIKEGDTVAYIESMKVMNAIVAEKSGTVAEILVNNGDEVEEEDVIIKLK